MRIKAQIITKKNFEKYGQLVSRPVNDPTSEDTQYRFWSNISHYFIDGETEIGYCTVYNQFKNIVRGMERHIRTPEILMPIDAPFILPVLLEGEDEVNSEAFIVNVGQAVVIDKGIWHGACLPLEKDESSYFVIFQLGTPEEDVENIKTENIEIET